MTNSGLIGGSRTAGALATRCSATSALHVQFPTTQPDTVSPQPDERTDEVDEAEEGAIQFVEAREDAAKMLEFVEATFDEMAFTVEPDVILTLDLGTLMGRNHCFAAALLQIGDEVSASIAAIRHHPLKGEAIKQRLSLRAVMALAGRQAHTQRIA